MFQILALILIFSVSAFGQTGNKMLIIDKESKALLRVFVTCQYKLVLKNPKDKEITISVDQRGNGYFAGEHKTNYDFVISVSHIFSCDSTLGELKASGILDDFDKTHDDDLSLENIVALKDGKISNISIFAYDGVPLSDIKILFTTPVSKLISDPDAALLKGVLPDDASHQHLPLMDDKIFDDIFYNDGIGKDVVVRGFVLFSGGWFVRYLDARVEWVMPNVIQINRSLHRGLSGSPLTYFHNGKIYAIGTISRGPAQLDSGLDMSWITIIKKSFLEKRNKK